MSAFACKQRQDIWVWLGSIVFAVLFCGGIYGFGALRGWDALSGYTHNTSATSADRFLPEPFVPDPTMPGRHGVDATGRWYYWKLPPDRVTALTRGMMWLCYVLHQFTVWLGLFMLQRQKMRERAALGGHQAPTAVYSSKLGGWNWFLFVANIFFHLVHLGQTHWTYDGLAQDTIVASSQSAVIMLLIFIMVIEYRDRGIVFGWPSQFHHGKWSKRLRLPYSPMLLVRKYHGYAFSWASVYTFWYHPMENTAGHVTGFVHTYFFLVQGSLAYTPFHLNKYWRFLLEVWVTAHGGVVAAQTGGPGQLGTSLWPMFVFGFTLLIAVTQLFGLPFWRKVPAWLRVIPFLVYLAVVVYMYSWIPDAQGRPWVRLNEPIRIPAVYYLYFFVVWAWTLLLLWLSGRSLKTPASDPAEVVGPALRWLCLGGVVAIYAVFVITSACLKSFDVQMTMISQLITMVGLFVLGVCVTNIFLQIVFYRFGNVITVSDSIKSEKRENSEDNEKEKMEKKEKEDQFEGEESEERLKEKIEAN